MFYFFFSRSSSKLAGGVFPPPVRQFAAPGWYLADEAAYLFRLWLCRFFFFVVKPAYNVAA